MPLYVIKPKGDWTRPSVAPGIPDTGRIVRLFVGQGYGFIKRLSDDEVYFHRSDVHEGTSINDLELGDLVAFDRLDDRISGPRALRVRRILRLL